MRAHLAYGPPLPTRQEKIKAQCTFLCEGKRERTTSLLMLSRKEPAVMEQAEGALPLQEFDVLMQDGPMGLVLSDRRVITSLVAEGQAARAGERGASQAERRLCTSKGWGWRLGSTVIQKGPARRGHSHLQHSGAGAGLGEERRRTARTAHAAKHKATTRGNKGARQKTQLLHFMGPTKLKGQRGTENGAGGGSVSPTLGRRDTMRPREPLDETMSFCSCSGECTTAVTVMKH